MNRAIVPISAFPEIIEIGYMNINLQDRIINYMKGKTVPIGGFYLNDVMNWIRWEEIPILVDMIDFDQIQ